MTALTLPCSGCSLISMPSTQGVVNPVIFDAECWIGDPRQLNRVRSVSARFHVTKSKDNLATAHPAKRSIRELPGTTFPKAAPAFPSPTLSPT